MGFIGLYIAVAIVAILISLIVFIGEGSEATRTGARIILLAPIWPLLLPVGLFRAVRWLWRIADWKGVEEEEEILRRQRRGILHDY